MAVLGKEEVVQLADECDELLPSSELGGEAFLNARLAVLAIVPFGGLNEIGNRKRFDSNAELIEEQLVVMVVHLRPGNDEQRGVYVAAFDAPSKRLRIAAERRALLEEIDFIAGAMKRPGCADAGDASSNDRNVLGHDVFPLFVPYERFGTKSTIGPWRSVCQSPL